MRWLLFTLCALLWVRGACATEQAPWRPVFGDAVSLVSTPDTVYAVGRQGAVWQWQRTGGFWGRLPGELRAIKVVPSTSQLWGMGLDGQVLRYIDQIWQPQGFKALDLALNAQGDLAWITPAGAILKRTAATARVSSLPGSAASLAIGSDGTVWRRTASGELSKFADPDWVPAEGRARHLGNDFNGDVVMVSDKGEFSRWNDFSNAWSVMPAPAPVRLATSAFNGTVWVVLDNGALQAQGAISQVATRMVDAPQGSIRLSRQSQRGGQHGAGGSARRRYAAAAAYVAITPSASVTDSAPYTFTDTGSEAAQLAIGAEGNVFAVALDRSVLQWRNALQGFKPYPGELSKVAVDPSGSPWGINTHGRIYRHDGIDWVQVSGLATDIAIGANGRVLIANAAGDVSEYLSEIRGFRLVPEWHAVKVAVARDGTPWGLLADGTVVRCDQSPCERLPQSARALAIGPDNTVFIVTPEGRLSRYRAGQGDWEVISVNGLKVSQVAVGPKGRPWVVAEDGSVLYSTQFPRDESLDTAVVQTTQTPTTAISDTGAQTDAGSFVISKNMRFGSVASSLAVLRDLTAGQDGSVLGIGYSDAAMTQPAFELYDSVAKRMRRQSVSLPNNDQFKTVKADVDGSLWFLSLGTNGRLYHKVNGAITTVDVLAGTTFCAVGACPIESSLLDLEIGPDGSLYVILADGGVWGKPATATKFSKLVAGAFRRVAVARSGDVWLMTVFGNELRQLVKGVAVSRPMAVGDVPLDVAGGANGSVYVVSTDGSTSSLKRWNAASQSFDQVNKTASALAVVPNGRPWVVDDLNAPGTLFFAK
jgi:Tectonin domain